MTYFFLISCLFLVIGYILTEVISFLYAVYLKDSKTYESYKKIHEILNPTLKMTQYGLDGLVLSICIILSKVEIIPYLIGFLIVCGYVKFRDKIFEFIYHYGCFLKDDPSKF